MTDSEPGLEREVALPAPRTFDIGGWASVSPAAADSRIDLLTGLDPRWTFDSSGRFEGRAGTARILGVRRQRPPRGSRRSCRAAGLAVGQRPARLHARRPDPVAGAGGLRVPHARAGVCGRRLQSGRAGRPGRRAAARPHGAHAGAANHGAGRDASPGRHGSPQPAGRGAGRGADTVAESACSASQRQLRLGLRRADVSAAGTTATAAVGGSIPALDSGAPLRLAGRGPHSSLALPAGATHVSAPPGEVMRAITWPSPRPRRAARGR